MLTITDSFREDAKTLAKQMLADGKTRVPIPNFEGMIVTCEEYIEGARYIWQFVVENRLCWVCLLK